MKRTDDPIDLYVYVTVEDLAAREEWYRREAERRSRETEIQEPRGVAEVDLTVG